MIETMVVFQQLIVSSTAERWASYPGHNENSAQTPDDQMPTSAPPNPTMTGANSPACACPACGGGHHHAPLVRSLRQM